MGWVLLCLLCCCTLVACDRKPKQYRVSLDEEPEKRWEQVIQDHMQYTPFIKEEAKQHFQYPYGTFLCWLCEKLALSFPDEYYREMAAIAKMSGIEFCQVIGLNILYDVTNFNHFIGHSLFACTSIISEDANGRILHGRNLDYMMAEWMRNVSIMVDFTRNDKVVYSALTMAFYTGVTTGQRPNAYSFSLNARRSGWYIYNILMQIYTAFRLPSSLAMRQTLENAATYEDALRDMSTMHLVAPSYLTLGGVRSGQGALITRDRWSSHDVMELDAKNGRFFIVETNFDHWEKDEDGRRTSAINNMEKIGISGLDENNMLIVLYQPPVANLWTVTTSVMSAATPEMFADTTVIRELVDAPEDVQNAHSAKGSEERQ